MTIESEYGAVTPVRRPDWRSRTGKTGLDVASPSPTSPFGNQGPDKGPVMSTGYPPITTTAPVRTQGPDGPASPSPTSPFGPAPKPAPIPGPSPSPTSPFNPVKPPNPTPPGPGTSGAPSTPGSLGLDFMRNVTPNELVANQLQGLLDGNSAYMKNARLRGAEYAASRGNLNSSIGAGASQRAALEAAMPIAQADADVYRQANQGNFESLSQLRQMRTAADLENWLSSESYTRDFNGRLAMMPIQSSFDMMQYVAQRALEDPAVYTPDVISGFNNFFNANMFDVFNTWFGTPPGGG